MKVWSLRDYKAVQRERVNAYSSIKMLNEYDCAEEQSRILAYYAYSGPMGTREMVYSETDPGKWAPVVPDSVGQTMWKAACGKGQSSGRAPASPPINASPENLQTLQTQATKGYAGAQYELGVLYANDESVPQDYKKATQWCEKAAAQGDADAQSNLGALYDKGYGVPQDYATARQWFE